MAERPALSADKKAGLRRCFERGDRAIPEHELSGCVACGELRRLEDEQRLTVEPFGRTGERRD